MHRQAADRWLFSVCAAQKSRENCVLLNWDCNGNAIMMMILMTVMTVVMMVMLQRKRRQNEFRAGHSV